MRACVRACVRACMHECVHAYVNAYFPSSQHAQISHTRNLIASPTPTPTHRRHRSHRPQEVPFHATKFAVFDAVSSALKASFLYSSSAAAASSSSIAATTAAAISILSG